MSEPSPTGLFLLASAISREPTDGATIRWIVVAAVVAATAGKRWLNRTSAVLLGGVGGTMAAGMFHNRTGAGLGLAVGAVVVASPWFRKPRLVRPSVRTTSGSHRRAGGR